jgi:methylenetetrahydrofolate reductase (NADPH)
VAYLKRKVDAGAEFSAITQFFFEAETFFRFRDACEKAGIDVPIIPGILPIENWKGVAKFAAPAARMFPPGWRGLRQAAIRDDRHDLLATALCTELCTDLIEDGVDRLHFYTLNKPTLTRDVCHALGVRSEVELQNVA